MGQQDSQFDDKLMGMQHDLTILQQLMAASSDNAISVGTKLDDIHSNMTITASIIETGHANTEQKLVSMDRSIESMRASIERLETLMVKSYQKSKSYDNI